MIAMILEAPEGLYAELDRLDVLLALLLFNLMTCLLYGWDKWCARRGARRVPERVLLLSAAVGGALGAWIGCSVFRHKTLKQSFRWKLVVATALNGAWLWVTLRPLS